jgi:hypothetical protein
MPHNDTRSQKEVLRDMLADGIKIQPQFKAEPLYKKTGRGSYQSNTVADIAAVKKTASRRR